MRQVRVLKRDVAIVKKEKAVFMFKLTNIKLDDK